MTEIQTISETDEWIAVDKPVNMLTVPSRQGAADERLCLKSLVQQAQGRQIWAVHRLDYEVSGVVLFAKTADFHRMASKAFEDQIAKKTYQALTETMAGMPGVIGQEWIWRLKLVRGKKRAFEAPHGKLAVTRARLESLDPQTGFLRWTLWPETGRSHQLRVSLAKFQCPIVGDRLYGSTKDYRGIALRAVALTIEPLKIDLKGPLLCT